MKTLFLLLSLISSTASAAEVISFDLVEKCFLCSSEPVLTMYWQGTNSKAVVLLIPGGEGYIGLKPGQTDLAFHQFQTLKRLTDPVLTSGRVDVVALDSPTPLSPNQYYPAARGSSDHLLRIESAIRYYHAKTGLPVWLMGHSNGGISLAEFLKYARKNARMDLIGGMIVSAARNESDFDAPIGFPMLFLHHRLDACATTTVAAAQRNYDKVKTFSTAPVAFVMVDSGRAEPRDPCRSGWHMYFDAGEEVANQIDAFMSAVYQ